MNFTRLCLIVISLLPALPAMLQAQEFDNYTITDGLSSIEVTDIRQNDNFMWIATCDGLNRFDGENFKIYKRVNNSSNCLSENNIEKLFFDSGGYLWIGLKTGGADLYDPRTDKFTNISKLIREKAPSRVISMMEDSQGNIWLGTWEEGVYKLISEGKGKKQYKAEIHYPGYIVSDIIEKPKGIVRIGTYAGMFAYDCSTRSWHAGGNPEIAITQFLDEGGGNTVWCSTWSSGLLKISWNSANPLEMNISVPFTGTQFNSIYRILGGDDNIIYLGTWGEGLKMVDTQNPSEAVSLKDKNFKATLINCLFRDRYNNIWIGTYGGGIFRFNPGRNGITHFPVTDKLPAPALSLASPAGDYVLVGTQGEGVYLYNHQQRQLKSVLKKPGAGNFSNYILTLNVLNNIVVVGHDAFGLTWAGITKENKNKLKFRDLYRDANLEKITASYEADDGRIWIGTKQNGLISLRMDQKTGQLTDYVHYDAFGPDEITGFASPDALHLFVSTHKGLFVFNTLTHKIEDDGSIITNEIVYRIVPDVKKGCLWIGTSTELLKLDLVGSRRAVKALPGRHLPQGAIRMLHLDKADNLWFAIGARLFCLTSAENRLREFNPALLGNHTILSSTDASIGGKDCLVLGTTDDLIILDPRLALRQPDETKILLTEIQVDHKKISVGEDVYGNVVLDKATEYVSNIRLSYKCRWISFSFTETGWDFYKNQYEYRIREFSETWQNIDLTTPVTFSQLNPGNYVLEIRRADAGTDAPIAWSMNFTIIPPWWKTLWFYIALAIFIIAVLVASAWLLVNYLRRRQALKLRAMEERKEAELLREKESFFSGLTHDLLTPFSLILAPVNDLLRESDAADPRTEKLKIISKNASFLSDIFSTIFDFKRAEQADSRLRETGVELVSFVGLVVNAFEYLAKSRRISLSYTSGVKTLNIITDNVKVERILYNLLSNAIKFTPDGGRVDVRLSFSDYNIARISVSDTGVGIEKKNLSAVFDKFYREPEKQGRATTKGLGLGLYVVRKFVDRLGGDIAINSSGSGTEVEITLPVRLNPLEERQEEPSLPTAADELSTVLIAEDNEQMRDYLSKKLSGNFNVITATNGNEALGYILEYMPEIVISDVMMPEMDGLTLCREIKENNRCDDIFVILLSAKSSNEDELLGYKEGADIYLKKPFDPEALLNQIINIQNTRVKRKLKLLASFVSGDTADIEFDPKETFLKHAMQVIEDNIMNTDFKIDEFAAEMNLSKTVLHRKFKVLIGQTPNQFIRLVRLRKSVGLLRNTDMTVAEIAYLTGFNQSHYFIKCFREVYHETPNSFRQGKQPA